MCPFFSDPIYQLIFALPKVSHISLALRIDINEW
jgi:hypothetical protein